MDFILAIILGVIEGLTEFLPVSSTGHLIVGSALLRFPSDALAVADPKAFSDTFSIFIQIGAILAVVVLFRRELGAQARQISRERRVQRFWFHVLVAFLPAAGLGFLLRDWITENLFSPLVVGLALIVGGLVFLWIEHRPRPASIPHEDQVTFREAFLIGLAQMTALIPGVSRAGASIVGGLLVGLDRPAATRFSFYLAIPTLGVATLYQLFSALRDGQVSAEHLGIFAAGTVVSFVVAWAVIAWLLRYVAHHNFRIFGYYRIGIGLLIVALAQFTSLFVR